MNAIRCLGVFAGLLGWLVFYPAVSGQEKEDPLATDEATLLAAGVKHDGASLLAFFKRRTPSEDYQVKLKELIKHLASDQYRVREKASADLLAAGRVVMPLLREAATQSDLEVKRRAQRIIERLESQSEVALILAAMRVLAARAPADADEVLLAYFPFLEEESIEEELHDAVAAVGVVKGKASDALMRNLQDKHVARRAAAARAAGRTADKDQRDLVRARLEDRDPRVRLRTAQGLIAGKDNQAIAALLKLLTDGPAQWAREAEDTLFQLAGDTSPATFIGEATDAERQKTRAAWDKWYKDEGSKLDLTKLAPHRSLGLTLCVAWDSEKGRQGRMFEIDHSGMERWSVEEVNHPVDGHMIRGTRFLVAEQSGRRVTERDLKGKVLWEHKVDDSLVSCKRLPNGNTWVVTYRKIFEVTRDNKVINYPIKRQINNHLTHAEKLRNGNIVYLAYDGELVEMDQKGEVKRTLKVDAGSLGLTKFEQLSNGNFLLCQQRQNQVQEINWSGKVLWQVNAPKANSATRLPSGNILISSYGGRYVMEVNRAGKVVWQKDVKSGLLNAYRR